MTLGYGKESGRHEISEDYSYSVRKGLYLFVYLLTYLLGVVSLRWKQRWYYNFSSVFEKM